MYLILTLGVLSVLMALVLTPIVRDGVGRFGFLDHPDGVRKKHAAAVPRVGGIAIVVAYVATFAIAFILPFSYTFVLRKALPNILQLSMVASMVFLTGVLDDLVGLTCVAEADRAHWGFGAGFLGSESALIFTCSTSFRRGRGSDS